MPGPDRLTADVAAAVAVQGDGRQRRRRVRRERRQARRRDAARGRRSRLRPRAQDPASRLVGRRTSRRARRMRPRGRHAREAAEQPLRQHAGEAPQGGQLAQEERGRGGGPAARDLAGQPRRLGRRQRDRLLDEDAGARPARPPRTARAARPPARRLRPRRRGRSPSARASPPHRRSRRAPRRGRSPRRRRAADRALRPGRPADRADEGERSRAGRSRSARLKPGRRARWGGRAGISVGAQPVAGCGVAGWRLRGPAGRGRGVPRRVAGGRGPRRHALPRAARRRPFRFVELAPSGPYEVLSEDGEPEGDGGVLLIARLARGEREPGSASGRLRAAARLPRRAAARAATSSSPSSAGRAR